MGSRICSIWRDKGLYVDAEIDNDGNLTLRGQDLSGTTWSEYEYVMTVRRDKLHEVISALGGAPSDDVLELLRIHAS